MGRRSRKRFKRRIKPVRKLPRIFQCPACGLPTLGIELKTYTNEEGEERKEAIVKCYNPNCGLKAILKDLPSIFSEVDAYAKFLDRYTEGTIEITYETSAEAAGEASEEG